jgi:hypothetical protein
MKINALKETNSDLKMADFWDVAPCSLVDIADISEELTASNIRVP